MKQRQTNEVGRGTKDERVTRKVASEWDGAVRGGMMKDGRRELVWKWGDGWKDPLHACSGRSTATEITAARCVHTASTYRSGVLPWSQEPFTNTWAHPGPCAPTQTSVISTVYKRREKIIRQIHSLNHCCGSWLYTPPGTPQQKYYTSLYILVNCNLTSQLCLPLSPAVISSPGIDCFSLAPNLSAVEVLKWFLSRIGQWNRSNVDCIWTSH